MSHQMKSGGGNMRPTDSNLDSEGSVRGRPTPRSYQLVPAVRPEILLAMERERELQSQLSSMASGSVQREMLREEIHRQRLTIHRLRVLDQTVSGRQPGLAAPKLIPPPERPSPGEANPRDFTRRKPNLRPEETYTDHPEETSESSDTLRAEIAYYRSQIDAAREREVRMKAEIALAQEAGKREEKLQREMYRLRDELGACREREAGLQSSLDEVRNRLALEVSTTPAAEAERESLRNATERARGKIAELTRGLEKETAQREELQQQIGRWEEILRQTASREAELTAALRHAEAAGKEIAPLQERLTSALAELDFVRLQSAEYAAEIATIQSQLARERERSRDREEAELRLKKELESLRAAESALSERLRNTEHLDAKWQQAQEEAATRDTELHNLREELREERTRATDRANAATTLEDHAQARHHAETSLAAAQQTISRLEVEMTHLRVEHQQSLMLIRELQAGIEQGQELSVVREDLENRLSHQAQALRATEASLASRRQAVDQLERDLEAARDVIAQLEAKMAEANAHSAAREQELNDAREQNAAFAQQLSESAHRLESLERLASQPIAPAHDGNESARLVEELTAVRCDLDAAKLELERSREAAQVKIRKQEAAITMLQQQLARVEIQSNVLDISAHSEVAPGHLREVCDRFEGLFLSLSQQLKGATLVPHPSTTKKSPLRTVHFFAIGCVAALAVIVSLITNFASATREQDSPRTWKQAITPLFGDEIAAPTKTMGAATPSAVLPPRVVWNKFAGETSMPLQGLFDSQGEIDFGLLRQTWKELQSGKLPLRPADDVISELQPAYDDVVAKSESGDPAAQFILGLRYLVDGVQSTRRGFSGSESIQSAYGLFRRAAQQGNLDALYVGGQMRRLGIGCQEDADKGLAVISHAAAAGQPAASEFLGVEALNLFLQTRVAEYAATSAAHFKNAAAQGRPFAEMMLGRMLLEGMGTPQDAARGIAYLTKAFRAGLKEASLYLVDAAKTGSLAAKEACAAIGVDRSAVDAAPKVPEATPARDAPVLTRR